jgi:hypothetical protein
MRRLIFAFILAVLALGHKSVIAEPAAWLNVTADDDYATVIHYELGPNEDISGCTYAMFVDHRKSFIRKIPQKGSRIASFTNYSSQINIISDGIRNLTFPKSEWGGSPFQRAYFRLLLTCGSEYRYSNIATLRVRRVKSGGVNTRNWAIGIKHNIAYESLP